MPPVQERLPETDTLTPEQEKMVADFIAANLPSDKLPPAYKNADVEEVNITAYKYLVARKWNMVDATKMFTEAMAFRESVGFDTSPLFPTPIPIRGYDAAKINEALGLPTRPSDIIDDMYHNVKRVQHFAFHYWDKTGHPVVIDCAGRANVEKLVQKFKEMTPPGGDVAQVAIDLHLHQNRVGASLVRYQDKIRAGHAVDGRRITSATIIMDAKDLGFGHLFGEAVEITKKAWAQDSQYFPEGMHRMFVVNCPSMIMFAYNLFKGMIDKRTQEKVTFCSPEDTPAILRTVIDSKHLPKFLGGECECKGGCVYDEKESDESTDPYTGKLVKTLDLTVAAGSSWDKTYDIEAGHTFVWQYESATGNDVEFSAIFEGSSSGKKEIIVAPAKNKSGSNSYAATNESGRLTIKFDNTFSWMKEKKIRYRHVKMSNEGVDLASPNAASPTFPVAPKI